MTAGSAVERLAIIVNDEPRSLAIGSTLADLVVELGLIDRKGVALAVNGGVVLRTTWPAHPLANGDRILVIRATQGG